MTQLNDPFPGIQHLENIQGFLHRMEVVPTEKPKSFVDQIVLVTNGGSTAAYIYEPTSLAWKYVLLT